MRGVDHRTGLGGHGGKMVEDVEADLPGLMELGSGPADRHERLPGLERRAVGQDVGDDASEFGGNA